MKTTTILVTLILLFGSIGFNQATAQENTLIPSEEGCNCTGGCVDGYFSVNGEVSHSEKMYLVNELTNETYTDGINDATGYYKFHNVPLGDYWIYPKSYENLKVKRSVDNLSDSRCVTVNFRLTEGCRPVYSEYHDNNFNLFQPAELPVIGTNENDRDANVLKYYALLADRMNIDAVKVKLDDLMFSVCGNDCNAAYENSLIKKMLDIQQQIREQHPEFQLKTVAVLDLRLGSLEENIQLLQLLNDVILTHPSYKGVTEKRKLPLFLISDPVLYNSTDIEQIAQLTKNLRSTLNANITQRLLVALDLNPASASLTKIRYIMHYVDTLYPRVDLSDNSLTPWTAADNEIGLKYLKSFYQYEQNLNLPVIGGNVWVGFDDRNTYGNHQTPDGQPTYIDKQYQDDKFLTSDAVWNLAYSRSPYVLVLETLNNWENATAFAPSVNYGNALTMDQWKKINKWKTNECTQWKADELALIFLNTWYQAVRAGHHSAAVLQQAEQLFFQKQYQQAIDLVQPIEVVVDDYALSFDGVDDYATVPNNAGLNVTENFTIEAWIKPDASNPAWSLILEKGSYDEYSLGFYANTGKVVGALSMPQGSSYRFKNVIGPSETVLQPGQWYHVAATYDGENARLYVNGVLESETPVQAVARRLNGDLILGATRRPNGETRSHYAGVLDELRIWNYARSAAQLADNMSRELNGDETGLVCYLPLNEESGQSLLEKTAVSDDGWLGSDLAPETVDPLRVPGDRSAVSGNNSGGSSLNQNSAGLTPVARPEKLLLQQNYPNPFNPVTAISYGLDQDSQVTLKVYDLSGREVATLVQEMQSAGYYTVNWDAGKLSSGIYFYRLQTNNAIMTRTMILLK